MVDYKSQLLEHVENTIEAFRNEFRLDIVFDGDISLLEEEMLEWIQDEIEKISAGLKSKVSIDNEEVTTNIAYFEIRLEERKTVYAYENVMLNGQPNVGIVHTPKGLDLTDIEDEVVDPESFGDEHDAWYNLNIGYP